MKVKELITALQEFDGELEVYGVSYHGHAPEKVCEPSLLWAEAGVHSMGRFYNRRRRGSRRRLQI